MIKSNSKTKNVSVIQGLFGDPLILFGEGTLIGPLSNFDGTGTYAKYRPQV